MQLSQEQQTILDVALNLYNKPGDHLLQVSAKAGSGKTFMLSLMSKQIQPESGRYIAYSKAIADESQSKFPDKKINQYGAKEYKVKCTTTHSLAYGNIVKNMGLTVGFFNERSIREKIDRSHKEAIVAGIDNFCLSDALDIEKFLDGKMDKRLIALAKEYLLKMQSAKIDVSHAFYLKMYHLALAAGVIQHPRLDLLMLDEAGDINAVTLAMFKLIPAKLKILVGDSHQNIFSFNGTINGFRALEGEGEYHELTQSFRVSSPIAKRIEHFMHLFLERNTVFKGVDYKPSEVSNESIAFISRTNSMLIDKMISLNGQHVKYNLTRKVSQIFELLAIIATLKHKGEVYNAKYRFLQRDTDKWYEEPSIQKEFSTPFKYIASKHADDIEVKNACALIGRHSKRLIMETRDKALANEKSPGKHRITLSTAHASKGLEFDEVYIMDDLNQAINKILEDEPDPDDWTNSQQEEARLYYVAASRAKHKLHDAEYCDLSLQINKNHGG